jgi:hypothetical protein
LNSGGKICFGIAAETNSGLATSALTDRFTQLPRDVAVRRQLLVLLDPRRLRAGGRAAVFPVGGIHRRAKVRNLRLAQYIRHTDQHRVCLHIERCGKQTRAVSIPPTTRPGATSTNGAAL